MTNEIEDIDDMEDTDTEDTVVVIRLVRHEGREGDIIAYMFLECRKSDGAVVGVEALPVSFKDEQEAQDIARGIMSASWQPVISLAPQLERLH